MVKIHIVMKKATFFKSAVLALLVCVGFAACENNSEVPEEPETYTVKLGWTGEILDISYEPLTTRVAGNDLYGIQVYSKAKTAGEEANWDPYAYGFFDDPDNVSITLHNNKQYHFIATMVRDGKNKVYSNNGYYLQPFCEKMVLGEFFYDPHLDMGASMKSGLTSMADWAGECYPVPNVERFFGKQIYIPDEDTDVQIDMKRTSFGARFVVDGNLAVDGKLEILISNLPLEIELTDGEDELFDIFTFIDVEAAWAALANDYTATIDVWFRWYKGNILQKDLGVHPITFKRNTTTTVRVNINSDGLDFNIPDSEQGDFTDGDIVVINNGELVEPEVEMGSDPDSW